MAINRRQKANCIVCSLINQNVQAAPSNVKAEIFAVKIVRLFLCFVQYFCQLQMQKMLTAQNVNKFSSSAEAALQSHVAAAVNRQRDLCH